MFATYMLPGDLMRTYRVHRRGGAADGKGHIQYTIAAVPAGEIRAARIGVERRGEQRFSRREQPAVCELVTATVGVARVGDALVGAEERYLVLAIEDMAGRFERIECGRWAEGTL